MVPTVALLLMLLAAASAAPSSFCYGRQGCSGRGECVRGGRACSCDPGYDGSRCDVWRAPVRSELLGVRWENCTHGRPGNDSGSRIVAFCDMGNKLECEAVGAPTVPPPNFNDQCYQQPGEFVDPRNNASSVCEDFRGVGTVIHGIKGVFCARPCATKSSLSCETCPCHPDSSGACPCKIMNKTSGKCMYCSGECQGEGKHPAANLPCTPGGALHCPCVAPPDANGKPILAQPQCILTNCADTPARFHSDSKPMCALTCDPDATVPPGRSNCQPGAMCERVPGAGFSPGGICTWPRTATMPPFIAGDNASAQGLPQLPPWTWADYKCAAANKSSLVPGAKAVASNALLTQQQPGKGPVVVDDTCIHKCPWTRPYSRFACIQNVTTGANWHNTFCVDVTEYASAFPWSETYGDAGCEMQCSKLPPSGHIPMPGTKGCNPPPPAPPPKPPPPPPPPLSTNPCIRFGHTIPVADHVTVQIVQEEDPSITYTWEDYKFAEFSDW